MDKIKRFLFGILLFTVSFLFVNNSVFAEASEEPHAADTHKKEGFNAGDMIFHHIKDAYEWHLFDIGGHNYSIYLPIIIYSKKDGLVVFSSKNFHHGENVYEGYQVEHGHLSSVDNDGNITSEASFWGFVQGEEVAFLDFSITKNVMSLFVSCLLLCLIFISVGNSYKKRRGQAPKGLQSFMEPLILFVRDDVAEPSIGKKYERYMPFLLSIFFFIWLNNMLGLIPIFPGGANLTGNIAVTVVLAIFTFVITTFVGNKNYWRHIFYPPGVPGWLIPLMVVIELIGVLTKPIVLTIRLFANIMAGHITILSFIGLIFIFGNLFGQFAAYGVSVVSLIFAIFLSLLELLVAFIQAYVFTLLSALYFGMATEEHH